MQRESAAAPTAQAILDKTEQPARFILRSDTGEVLQEYPLDKPEIVIGRAPTSDILLSKDKLTSRRHANVRYENGKYLLSDEHSANGTFVNGEQIQEVMPHVLRDGDKVDIGEHQLIFRAYGSPAAAIEDLRTVAVNQEITYRTRDDAMATIPSSDEFGTHTMESGEEGEVQMQEVPPSEPPEGARQAASLPLTPTPEPATTHGDVSAEPEPVASDTSAHSVSKNRDQAAVPLSSVPVDTSKVDTNVNFS